MKEKEILLFGGSGFIGSNLIRKLTKNNYKVKVVTRNIHKNGIKIKTQGNFGYIELIETNIFDLDKLNEIIEGVDICINLIGILYENKKNKFSNIHTNFPYMISKICKEKKVKQLIHFSALGIEESSKTSKYALSKLEGEKLVKENFKEAIIIRPSIVYGVEDNFTNLFMSILSIFPFFPLYYHGKTKFSPIHVSDLTDIIYNIVDQDIRFETIECVGNETMNFKEIIEKLCFCISKKRLLFPMPLPLAKLVAYTFEKFMSKPLLTKDQLELLKYDNVISGRYKTNFDFNFTTTKKFKFEIEKYSYIFKEHGEYSKKEYNNK